MYCVKDTNVEFGFSKERYEQLFAFSKVKYERLYGISLSNYYNVRYY